MLLYTYHSSAFSIPSSSKLLPFGFPNIGTGNHSTSRRTRASKEWAITLLDSARQWMTAQYLTWASSSSGSESTVPICPFPLSTCGRFIQCTQSPSTSDSMNSWLFCFHHRGNVWPHACNFALGACRIYLATRHPLTGLLPLLAVVTRQTVRYCISYC